ncbi:MAG: OB-fold nucleic acid binding domain-containing protein, partial [Xanthomonadales bacterium]|nr:OB-fold nucleic acid binding domain-containing protein [Xanthomonadales bacterium]
MTGDGANDLLTLDGVGPKLAERLGGLGIHRVTDLLFHLPLRYEDRTSVRRIGSLQPGQRVQVEGEVEHAAIVPARRRMLVVMLADGTGRITLRFFHFTRWQAQQLKRGARLRVFGDIRAGWKGLEMVHPQYTRLREDRDAPLPDRLTPVYPGTEGLRQPTLVKLTDQALERLREGRLAVEELLPAKLLENLRLPGLAEAIETIHRPPPDADTAALVER